MNNWSPERRVKFATLVAGTALVLVALWLGGIGTLRGWLEQKRTAIDSLQASLRLGESARALRPQYQAEAEACLRQLRELEGKMARGDLYRWVINHVLDFQEEYHVSVMDFQPPKVSELDLPPSVPYKAATCSLSGNAHYQDFGTFLAHLENSSPFIRLRALTLQANPAGFMGSSEPERLAFQVDFTVLVSTNALAP